MNKNRPLNSIPKPLTLVLTLVAAITASHVALAAPETQSTPPQALNQTGLVLPQPTPAFKGVIKETFEGSKQDFPQPIKAAKGSASLWDAEQIRIWEAKYFRNNESLTT